MMTHRIVVLALAAGLGIAAAQAPAGPVRVSRDVALANRTDVVPPEYPEEARRARVQGEVRLDVLIDKSGKPSNIKVLSGLRELADAAMKAVMQWRYRPTLLNGQAVEVITEIQVDFTLE